MTRLTLTPPEPAPARPPRLPVTDVSYVVDDTEVGRLLLAARPDGVLVACAYAADDAAEQGWLQRLADAVSPRVLRHPRPLDPARRALAAYLAGEARAVDVPLDLALARSGFQRAVLEGLRALPYGGRTTYAALAADIGRAGAARAVGTALGGNPLCIALPCHRVLPATGGVGGYAGGARAKEHLLRLEADQ